MTDQSNESTASNVAAALTSLCPKCGYTTTCYFSECPKCGIVVEKFERLATTASNSGVDDASSPSPVFSDFTRPVGRRHQKPAGRLSAALFSAPARTNPLAYAGRFALFFLLSVWGMRLALSSVASNAAGKTFLHLVNLPFHEAGHIIFSPFGQFISSFGGTLGQLLVPVVCLVTFLIYRKDSFGASVSLWWFGENLLDIAPYIDDARAGVLPLIGGNTGQAAPYGFHDWQFLLNETGLLSYDHAIAAGSHGLGSLTIVIALLWGGALLWKQYGCLRPGSFAGPSY